MCEIISSSFKVGAGLGNDWHALISGILKPAEIPPANKRPHVVPQIIFFFLMLVH